MDNLSIIVKKEFSDLISSNVILFMMFIFILLVSSSLLSAHDMIFSGDGINLIGIMLYNISYVFMSYGSILSIMIGFFLISNEKANSAINTLASKPIYRDTIINGKVISSMIFLTIVFCFVAILYTSLFIIINGDIVGNMAAEYSTRLSIIFLVSLLDAIYYLLLSMLMAIIIRKPGVALISTVVLFIFLDLIVPTVSFASNINILIDNNTIYNLLRDVSPSTSLTNLVNKGLFDSSVDLADVMNTGWGEITRLLIYIIALVFICYNSFIRSDLL